VPAAAGVADEIDGFCWLDAKEFGPVHEYVAPAPASGTEAPWPPELEQAEEGAVIVASGDVLTTAVVIATGDGQEFAVAVTL